MSFQLVKASKQTGFTLIEIMVVLVILAVMAALIVGGIQGAGDRNAKLESQRFVAVVNDVRDEAVISGKNIFLSVDEGQGSYEFSLQRVTQGSIDTSLFRKRFVHDSVSLKWEVFERQIGQGEEADFRILITSLGEITPFRSRFIGEERDFMVSLNDDGELYIEAKASGAF